MKRDTIPAFVVEADDLAAELATIDENLVRNDLTPAERARAVARRKAIYEYLHPETKRTSAGGDGRHKQTRRQVGDESVAERFTRATAEITSRSERDVQRDAHRGEALGEDALAKIARTSLDKGEELDALVKLPAQKRDELVARANGPSANWR